MSQQSSEGPDAAEGRIEDATRGEEEREAQAAHTADRPPTADEEAAAEANTLDPEVSAHEREMDKLGADVKGEGEIR
jgi:hypothetical protein